MEKTGGSEDIRRIPSTAPYTCPKSALILANARTKLVSQLLADPNFLGIGWSGAINGLALLAGVAPGDPNYVTVQARLQAFARSAATTGPQDWGLPIWDWGYMGLFFAEYYLSTGDPNVVAGINSYAVALTQPTGITGTITPAALTVTAGSQSKTYGQTLAFGSGATLFTSNGLRNGETIGSVTLACPGGDPAAVATYPITPGAATGGTFNAGNYIIGYVPGTLTVTPLTMAAYETWAGSTIFDSDTSGDGVANGLAWLLGAADPSANASALLPKPTNEGGKLVLVFRCLKTANRGAAVLKVQFSNDPGQPDQWASNVTGS